MTHETRIERPYRRTALVLQGGGALGAYQVGVFQALSEAGHAPDWFAGTSIGAINAAIMAGNPPEERLARLESFWDRIAWPQPWPVPENGTARWAYNAWNGMLAAWVGQPSFFRPRYPSPWALTGEPCAASIYDPSELRRTLGDLIDFDLINAKAARLSLGAVNVTTGQQVYFDSRDQRIGIDHVLASAAFPPAFPPVEIEGEWYWDGGIVSNTPLDAVIDDSPRRSTLVFMVDLFDGKGQLPTNMDAVAERRNDLVYATRSRRSIQAHRTIHDLRRAVSAMWERLPPEAQADPHLQELAKLRCVTTMNIVHILYRGTPNETSSKDHDFSSASIDDRRQYGYADARRMLADPHWLEPPPEDVGVIVHEANQSEHADSAV